MVKTKDKEKILKGAREKQALIIREPPHRLSVEFSAATLQSRREWQDIFKVLKGKKMCSLEYSTQQEYHFK